jgi:hypothetical protein
MALPTTPPSRQGARRSVVCSARCARARKTRLQYERRWAARERERERRHALEA